MVSLIRHLLLLVIHILFYKKLRIGASTGSFLKLSDFEYSEFLRSSMKVLYQSSCPLPGPPKNISNKVF